MSDYKTCDNCGYYPVKSGYNCPNCGKHVYDSESWGLAILLIATIIGSIFLAAISFFQNFKRKNYKRALWFSIGGIVWSLLVFLLIFGTDIQYDKDLEDIVTFLLWFNGFGILSSLISFIISLSKLSDLKKEKMAESSTQKHNESVEQVIKKTEKIAKPISEMIESKKEEKSKGFTKGEIDRIKKKSRRAVLILSPIILILIVLFYFPDTISFFHDLGNRKTKVERKQDNLKENNKDVKKETLNESKYYIKSETIAGIPLGSKLKAFQDNFPNNKSGWLPTDRGDSYPVHEFYIDNNKAFVAYFEYDDSGNYSDKVREIKIYSQEFKTEKGISVGITLKQFYNKYPDLTIEYNPEVGEAYVYPNKIKDIQFYVDGVFYDNFRNFDWNQRRTFNKNEINLNSKIAFIRIWEEKFTNKYNKEYEKEDEEKYEETEDLDNEDISDNMPTTNTIIRDPRAKDVANVYWDSKFTLFCKLTDEAIFPNSNGEYDIWYASHEEPYPHHKIVMASQLTHILYYKFKDYETCKQWCDNKKGK